MERVPENLVELLMEWNENNSEFLVGDAPGADLSFQKILKRIGAKSVTVFSSATSIRNNFGNWPTKQIESGLKSKSNAVHAFKDRFMTSVSDSGLMLWDCKSAGTLSNVIDLVSRDKECFVWTASDEKLNHFKKLDTLNNWMEQYPEVRNEANKRLKLFRKREIKRNKNVSQQDLFAN